MNQRVIAQPEIEVFTGPGCGFCHRAKALLERRGLRFREIDTTAADGRNEMQRRLPRSRSIPQIFIGGDHIGGCQDLERIDADGTLGQLTGGRIAP